MSTRSSIAYSEDKGCSFHCYHELTDNDYDEHVHLDITGDVLGSSPSVRLGHDERQRYLSVKLPIAVLEKIGEALLDRRRRERERARDPGRKDGGK